MGASNRLSQRMRRAEAAPFESVRTAARRACRVVSTDRPLVSAKGRRRLRAAGEDAVVRAFAAFARDGDGCALVESGAIVDFVGNGDLTVDAAAAAAEVLKLRLARTAHRTERYELRVAA